MLRSIIQKEALRFTFLLESDKLNKQEKYEYKKIISNQEELPDDVLENSLRILSALLYKHYGIKVILLIDEYDVPLDKAYQNGYYKEMVAVICNLLGMRRRIW